MRKEEPVRPPKVCEEGLASYVLITCKKPTSEGQMEVEMSYEGDPDLVAFLIESACVRIQEQM